MIYSYSILRCYDVVVSAYGIFAFNIFSNCCICLNLDIIERFYVKFILKPRIENILYSKASTTQHL